MNKYYIIGSGGFAKEVYFQAKQALGDEFNFIAFIDAKLKDKSIQILMGIGNPQTIADLSKKYSKFLFPNIIHPSFIGDVSSIKLGKGNIINAGCIFTINIKIGSFNIFNLNTTIGHDTSIKDYNIFNPGCNVSGGTIIGSRNLFGTNCAVLQSLSIGNDNIIGAMALVNKNIDSNSKMIGVPVKKMER